MLCVHFVSYFVGVKNLACICDFCTVGIHGLLWTQEMGNSICSFYAGLKDKEGE